MVWNFQGSSSWNDFWWNKFASKDQKWMGKFVDNPKAKVIDVNDQIKAPKIIIIDDEKKNMGTFSRQRALEIADEAWLDLVQIAYNAEEMVSTVRLTDYGKYMYQKWKEEKEKKKQQKGKKQKK